MVKVVKNVVILIEKIKTRKGRDGWIKDFIEKHGCKYNYDLVGEDINYYSEIEIICPIHGKFKQCVGSHANGQGCPNM